MRITLCRPSSAVGPGRLDRAAPSHAPVATLDPGGQSCQEWGLQQRRCLRSGPLMNALRLLFSLACAALMVSPASAWVFDEKSGSKVDVIPLFSAVPPGGYMPVRVEIENRTDSPVQFSFTFTASAPSAGSEEHALESSFTCSGEKQSTAVHTLSVPLFPDLSGTSPSSSGGYSGGPGRRGSLDWKERGGEAGRVGSQQYLEGMLFTLFSEALSGPNGSDLPGINAPAQTRGRTSSSYGGGAVGEYAASFKAKLLPEDWRSYCGVDVLCLSAEEWVSLAPGVQTALRQWIITGGRLHIFHTGAAPPLDSLRIRADRLDGTTRATIGSGSVNLTSWDGKLVSNVADDLARLFSEPTTGARRKYAAESQHTGGSPLADELGERSFAAWQVGLILLIFGVLVGPVNLFKFAGPGRRHRLFFTTPLISLAASLVLMAVIFFQDGTGGEGRRAALIHLRGGENVAVLKQEQISRTGVLFGGAFKTAEPAVVEPLLLPENRWRRLKQPTNYGYYGRRSGGGDTHRLTAGEDGFAGDWFQSRSEQAQSLTSVRSTRGRVELSGTGEAPSIVSSLPCTLEQFFYQAPDGKVWSAPGPVTQGQSVTLAPSSRSELDQFFKASTTRLSRTLRREAESGMQPGTFVATSRSADAGLMDTFDSIRWKDDFAVLQGPL